MTDITELAQRNELLIANGQQTADLLRHLADNEIDSDYFAVVSECESYGKETDAELSITEFALRAAGYVDALVEALEKAQQTEKTLEIRNRRLDGIITAAEQRIAELESRTVTVENLQESAYRAGLTAGWNLGLANNNDGFNKCLAAHTAGIKVEAE
ncbi:TPA: hypothetical protein QIZ47_002939 [Klebsiella pneumoniae subsp. pneumoniae]|nr:hypothetical protein [Klebsiella pneumoniae subsp. pneumoniae]